MLSLLIRRSIFLVLATSILDLNLIQFSNKHLVLDGLVVLNILVLLKSFGGVSLNLLVRLFSQRQFQKNIIGLTTNWLFSRGFINILAVSFLIISLFHWAHQIPYFPMDLDFGAQNAVFRNAGLLLAFIGFFLDSPLTFAWLRKVDLTPSRLIFVYYGLATLVGTILLIMPVSLNDSKSLHLIDSMFITVSALSVTGLTTVHFTDTFSLFGQLIVMILIQIGGLGILALSIAFVAFSRQKLSIHHTLMGNELYNNQNLGGLQNYLGKVTITTFLIELLGAVYIYIFLPAGLQNRFFHAVFQSISAFCNAGFSSLPESANIPGAAGFKFGLCVLIVLGGLGFPVFFEFIKYLKQERTYKKLSGHASLVLVTTLSLLISGGVLISVSEFSHLSKIPGDMWNLVGESFFYSVSSRTAGFNITPVANLSFLTQVLIALLMFVGGSPMSTAGGIKTTTLGIIVASAWSSLKGRRWIQFRRTTVPQELLQKAITIIMLYFSVLIGAIIVLSITEEQRIWEIVFESISAISTVGLSLGITEQLSVAGKIVLIILMLAGRVGLVSLAYLGLGRIREQKYQYAKDNYYVG